MKSHRGISKFWLPTLLFGLASVTCAYPYDDTSQSYYPCLTAPKRLYVAAIWNTANAIAMPSDADSYHRDVVQTPAIFTGIGESHFGLFTDALTSVGF